MKRWFVLLCCAWPVYMAMAKPNAVTAGTFAKTLYFDSQIEPIHVVNLSSPVSGTVESVHFQYGKPVKQGDLLLVLSSDALENQYQQTLTQYLKAKDAYLKAKTNLVGSKELFASGLIARNTYQSDESAMEDSYLSYMQARRKLEHFLAQAYSNHLNEKDIEKLTLHNQKAVTKAFQAAGRSLRIEAPQAGVVLSPLGDVRERGARFVEGSQIKEDKTLFSIGDLSGVRLHIQISQLEINDIRLGQAVKVTGPGFVSFELKGQVTHIDAQAHPDDRSGMPVFDATIDVKALPDGVLHVMRVGMSAEVALMLQKNTPTVPIKAVQNEKGKAFVHVVNPETKKIEKKVVATGETMQKDVSIPKGLMPGAKVVLHDNA